MHGSSNGGSAEETDAEKSAREAESERLLEVLVERNRLDLELYAFAKELARDQLRAAGVTAPLPGDPGGPPLPTRESCMARFRRQWRQMREDYLKRKSASSPPPSTSAASLSGTPP
mmetsp:Transcript_47690/g.126452  ORF Transcript_47690/g.126452 Transcript_47690/m.126452 type:complete len:116 (+) Transcript_47690:1389-1736(+)